MSFPATAPLCMWMVGWVSFFNTINEMTVSGNIQLSDKIMILYNVIYWELIHKADWQIGINAQGRSLPQSQTHQRNRSSNSLVVLLRFVMHLFEGHKDILLCTNTICTTWLYSRNLYNVKWNFMLFSVPWWMKTSMRIVRLTNFYIFHNHR